MHDTIHKHDKNTHNNKLSASQVPQYHGSTIRYHDPSRHLSRENCPYCPRTYSTSHVLFEICQQPNIYLQHKNELVQTGPLVPMVMCLRNRPLDAGICLPSSVLACDVYLPFGLGLGIATVDYELAINGYFKLLTIRVCLVMGTRLARARRSESRTRGVSGLDGRPRWRGTPQSGRPDITRPRKGDRGFLGLDSWPGRLDRYLCRPGEVLGTIRSGPGLSVGCTVNSLAGVVCVFCCSGRWPVVGYVRVPLWP